MPVKNKGGTINESSVADSGFESQGCRHAATYYECRRICLWMFVEVFPAKGSLSRDWMRNLLEVSH